MYYIWYKFVLMAKRYTANKKNTGSSEPVGAHAGSKSKKARNGSSISSVQISNLHTIPTGEKIAIIRNGVSKNELQEIKDESNLDYDTLSNILSVSRAKLINKKPAEKFDQATSERIMLLADVIAYGQSVFEDKELFNTWMKKPSVALGGKTPLEMMDTIYGLQEVKKELGRIEYGVY
jgi:putative toxin-antitoxin system antitoxin component (TIGR02293 family)